MNLYFVKKTGLSAFIGFYLRPIVFVFLVASFLILPSLSLAADQPLEKDFQKSLEQSRSLIITIQNKLSLPSNASIVTPEIAQLKALAENIKISELLLSERFKVREERLKKLGSKALDRHQDMAEGYRKAIQEYLNTVDSIQETGDSRQYTVDSRQLSALNSLLDKILPRKKKPILGSLPYKHLNYPARELSTDPNITPAYLTGTTSANPEDIAGSPEAPISKEIATLAQSLNWNPVSIYEYVKNNIDTEWYWGCMKGAEETLHQKSGNDCDQAALLTALLRASNFPTRYVRGTIEFFGGGKDLPINRIKNLTGIDDPAKIAEFFQKAGIPYKPIITAGTISNFQIEHVWVESFIPMDNYRGVVIDDQGKTWLGLDTSIKTKDYVYNNPKDIFEEQAVSDQLSAIRDAYLKTAPTGSTPLEHLQASVNAELKNQQSELLYTDFLRIKTLPPHIMNILPYGMQFIEKKITNEYLAIPDDLKHKVKLSATSPQQSDPLFEATLDTLKLSNQQVVMSYEPESVQDQEIIDSYGGLSNTPAYLVRLRPVLKINGARVIVAKDGLPMGGEYNLAIELQAPGSPESGAGGATSEKITNTQIAGNLSVIGIVAQKSVSNQQSVDSTQQTAESLLYTEAKNYIDRWNKAEDELASLLHLSIARPIPTIVTIGGVMDLSYVLDTPHGITWKGVFVDANLRAIETVSRTLAPDNRTLLFTQLSSLQGSVLENRIFEDDFKVQSISTAKLFQLSYQPSALSGQLFTIDKTNIDAILPTLSLDDNVKEDIQNSVNQNLVVRLPQADGLLLTAVSYENWMGIGYIKENPNTGESGWMLSGMIAGGMTVEIPENWINQFYVNTLAAPFTGPTNPNPAMAVAIFKVSGTDMQTGVVAKTLSQPLAAFVSDAKGIPVEGASVSFEIIAGAGDFGKLQCLDAHGSPIGQPGSTCAAPSSHSGFARAKLTLGKKTADNPYYIKLNEATDKNYTQVGLNIVNAFIQSSSGPISLAQPFEAYGAPDLPKEIKKNLGDGASAIVNSPAGTIKAVVVDEHGNPISNLDLVFTARPAVLRYPESPLPPGFRNIRFYNRDECPVATPLIEDCTTYDPLTRTTQYFGAQVDTILGNTVGTEYTVEASVPTVPSLSPAVFTLYSSGYRNASDGYIPATPEITALQTVNDNGQPINAAKAGTALKAPLASMLVLHEDDPVLGAPFTCTLAGGQAACRYIKSSGIINTRKISDGTVIYTPKTAGSEVGPLETLGNGEYRVAYTTAPTPAVNLIDAYGTATLTVPEVFGTFGSSKYVKDNGQNTVPTRSVNIQTGQQALFDASTLQVPAPPTTPVTWVTYQVYGVDTTLKIEPSIVPLSEQGYTTTDIAFTYTILPAEYNADSATMDFWKSEPNQILANTWDGWLTGDKTQDTGSAGLVRGTAFDVSRLYAAEVVLNRGSDAEVRSQKKTIPLAQINVVTDEGSPTKVEEMKYGNGSKEKKRYRIELKSMLQGQSCGDLSGTIRSVVSTGQTVTTPESGYNPAQYNLTFTNAGNGCNVMINGKEKFIVSNRSTADLDQLHTVASDTAVLYGGIGSTIVIEIQGARKIIPVEPVGVIVLGIDGLRQDVLYPNEIDKVQDGGKYRVDISSLPGLSQVLAGYDQPTEKQQYIMLPEVTAIFPSITLASWASIFSGKTPSDTGIVGNEFFARDLFAKGTGVPRKLQNGTFTLKFNPAGIISFDSGAFQGYDQYSLYKMLRDPSFFIPYQFDWQSPVSAIRTDTAEGTPQNDPEIYTVDTIFERITGVTGKADQDFENVRNYFNKKGGDPVVVSYSHYARGAYWVTWDAPEWYDGESSTLDRLSSNKFTDYLKGKYATIPYTTWLRNKVPFSALTVWYLPGLDHEAHKKGMGAYRNYFQTVTDGHVNDIVATLKGLDEFDNKIFIIVADHGHTAMPMDLKYKDTNWLGVEVLKDAESSCDLKLNFGDSENPDVSAQNAELNNNNLHIWELGDAFKALQKKKATLNYRVLAPNEIAKLFVNAPAGARVNLDSQPNLPDFANVIAAMNGPMAHIYLKGQNWQTAPDEEELKKLAEVLRILYQVEDSVEAGSALAISEVRYLNLLENNVGRLKQSVDKILIRIGGEYLQFNGYSGNGYAVGPLSFSSEYIKAPERVAGLNHPTRSGDIVLIMKDNTADAATSRYTTGVACKSWHGSLNASDSYVPFIVTYPGGNKSELTPMIDSTQKCSISQGCDGNWRVTDLITTIMQKQYGSQ